MLIIAALSSTAAMNGVMHVPAPYHSAPWKGKSALRNLRGDERNLRNPSGEHHQNFRGSGRNGLACEVACGIAEAGAETLCGLVWWTEPECGFAAGTTYDACAAAACASNDDSDHHEIVKRTFATSPFCNGKHTGRTAKSREAQHAFCAAPWKGKSAF